MDMSHEKPRKNTRNACYACKSSKRGCDSNNPCTRCSASGIACIRPTPEKVHPQWVMELSTGASRVLIVEPMQQGDKACSTARLGPPPISIKPDGANFPSVPFGTMATAMGAQGLPNLSSAPPPPPPPHPLPILPSWMRFTPTQPPPPFVPPPPFPQGPPPPPPSTVFPPFPPLAQPPLSHHHAPPPPGLFYNFPNGGGPQPPQPSLPPFHMFPSTSAQQQQSVSQMPCVPSPPSPPQMQPQQHQFEQSTDKKHQGAPVPFSQHLSGGSGGGGGTTERGGASQPPPPHSFSPPQTSDPVAASPGQSPLSARQAVVIETRKSAFRPWRPWDSNRADSHHQSSSFNSPEKKGCEFATEGSTSAVHAHPAKLSQRTHSQNTGDASRPNQREEQEQGGECEYEHEPTKKRMKTKTVFSDSFQLDQTQQ